MNPILQKIVVFLGLPIVICTSTALCQQGSSTKGPALQIAALDGPNSRVAAFRERDLGSIGGRVVDNSDFEKVPPVGIASVKVILRSTDPGFENFSREMLTNDSGAYSFMDLPAGNYRVNLDEPTLPGEYRSGEPQGLPVSVKPLDRTFADLTLEIQRTITGIVFMDNDGDGRYKVGTDDPVAGAKISYNGTFMVSGQNGTYVLRDLPSGRFGFLVTAPRSECNAHVVLDLPEQT